MPSMLFSATQRKQNRPQCVLRGAQTALTHMVVDDRPTPAHLRLKAATAVVTVAITVGLLLCDWDTNTGHGHPTVFTTVRPAIKSALNRLYGRDGAAAAQQEQQQQQQRQHDRSTGSSAGAS